MPSTSASVPTVKVTKPTTETLAGNENPWIWTPSIWKHFTKNKNVDIKRTEAKCHYCNSVLKIECGSTSSLARHLNAKHHDVFLTFKSQTENNPDKPKKEYSVRLVNHNQNLIILELQSGRQTTLNLNL